MRILIVDDNKDNLSFLETLFVGIGYKVATAINGKKALEILNDNNINLIVSDILMPDMDGFQFLREVKADNNTNSIPFVFYTATYTTDKDKEFGLQLGADRYLQKPMDPEPFVEIIQGIIDDYTTNKLKVNKPVNMDEDEVLKLYNERLVQKLEKKMLDLEDEVAMRKQTEQELVTALEKAKESDQLKTAFMQNMSHEIRTPMNGILGFSNLLRNPNLTGDQQQSYTKIILRSGKRMLHIIDNLMEISIIEANQVKVNLIKTNINDELNNLFAFFKPKADSKKLEFTLSIPPSNINIFTDNDKLCTILSNLIENSLIHTQNGSIDFGYVIKGKMVEFYVQDTGIGIPQKSHQAIFDRFVQADLSLTKNYEGAGLGLSISKAYVEKLGGEIWLESKEGIGSTFYVTIPIEEDEGKISTSKSNEKEKPPIPDKKLKILIVDDEDTVINYLNILLEPISRELLYAERGNDAIELCRKNHDIDIILMDIKMPNMSGYTATKLIREFNKDVIIIAQTAYALIGDKEKAISAGCNDYIAKPIDKDELMEMINVLL